MRWVVRLMTSAYDRRDQRWEVDMAEKESKAGASAFARWRERRREKQRHAAAVAAKVRAGRARDADRAAARDAISGPPPGPFGGI